MTELSFYGFENLSIEVFLLSIFYGIVSAATWGAADFLGGLATKRTSPYRVLFLGQLSGLILFFILALITGETIPPVTTSSGQ